MTPPYAFELLSTVWSQQLFDLFAEFLPQQPITNVPTLLQAFHGLRAYSGSEHFNAGHFDAWAKANLHPDDGGIHAARFVLYLWDSTHQWTSGQWDLKAALWAWDDFHLAAFQLWCLASFEP